MSLQTIMQGAATAITVLRAVRIARNLVQCPQCGQKLRISKSRRKR